MSYENTSNSGITLSNSPIVNVPCTIAAWFKPNAAVTQTNRMTLGVENSTGTAGFMLGSEVTGLFRIFTRESNANTVADSTAGITMMSGNWYHTAGVFTSASSRTPYLNGVAGTTNTGSRIVTSTLDRTSIFFRIGAQTAAYLHEYAEVGIWNVALDAAEIESLSKGVKPPKIRPQNLVLYIPFDGQIIENRGFVETTFTTTGTINKVNDHPRRYG